MAEYKLTEEQMKELSGAHELLKRLYANKETKRDIEKLAKKVNPDAVTTDDIAAPFMEEIKKELEPLMKWKDGMEKKIDDYNKLEEIKQLKSAGYTEDGLKAIEKIAEEKKLGLFDASAIFDKTAPKQPQAPNGISPSMFNFHGELGVDNDQEDWKKAFGGSMAEEDAALDRVAARAMNDFGLMRSQ
jgi:hypothetical protein